MYVLSDALVQVLPQLWSKQRNRLFFGSQGHVRDCTAPPVFHMRGHSNPALVDVVMAAAAAESYNVIISFSPIDNPFALFSYFVVTRSLHV